MRTAAGWCLIALAHVACGGVVGGDLARDDRQKRGGPDASSARFDDHDHQGEQSDYDRDAAPKREAGTNEAGVGDASSAHNGGADASTRSDASGGLPTRVDAGADDGAASHPPPNADAAIEASQPDAALDAGVSVLDATPSPDAKPPAPEPCKPYWTFDLVEPNVGTHVDSSVVARDGTVHIAYTNRFSVHYASNAGGTWTIEMIQEDAFDAWDASLELDGAGVPHVAYVQDGQGVIYATRAGGVWSRETIEPSGGRGTALALDSSGNPHVTYYGQGFRYAVRGAAGWVATEIDSNGYYLAGSSVAIDETGAAHMSFGRLAGNIHEGAYATNVSGAWTLSSFPGGFFSSLALDGGPVISYGTEPGGRVQVTRPGGTTSDVAEGVGTSLARSPDGSLHVTFFQQTPEYRSVVTHATNSSGSWVATPVDSYPSPWSIPDLAVSSEGDLYVSYATYQTANDGLVLARRCVD